MAPPSRRVKSPATKPSQTLDVTTLRKVPRAAIFKNLAMLQLATLSHQVYELCLTPVYGSISSAAVNLDNLLVILLWLTIMFPPQRMLNVARLVPILGCLAPVIQSILYKYSGRMGPQQGPLLSYSITSFPILSLSLFINIEFIIRVVSNNTDTHKLADSGYVHAGLKSIAILLLVYAFSQLMTVLKGTANFVLTVLPSITDIASSRFGLHALMVTLWALFARSKATLFLGVLSIVCITFLVPHLPTTNNIRFINTNLLSSGYSLVARQESLTGYISVLDNLKDGFRVMRCDHSLLGGEWINKPEGHPAKFNEPIYSIFVMLEAVRLVETQSSRKMEEKLDSEKQALAM